MYYSVYSTATVYTMLGITYDSSNNLVDTVIYPLFRGISFTSGVTYSYPFYNTTWVWYVDPLNNTNDTLENYVTNTLGGGSGLSLTSTSASFSLDVEAIEKETVEILDYNVKPTYLV